jgi:ankyrin repeat protein
MPGLVKLLLAKGANPNVRLVRSAVSGSVGGADATPFLMAAAAGDVPTMRLLVEGGADSTLANKAKVTPLMAAAGLLRSEDFTEEERRNALEAVKLMVELGADVNAVNELGRTALHGATNLGANDVIQYLVEHGAKLDVRDKYQQTPLSIASGVHLPWTPKGQELGEVIRKSSEELLLKLGATPLDTPGYFTPVELDSDAYRMNPRRTVPGTTQAGSD